MVTCGNRHNIFNEAIACEHGSFDFQFSAFFFGGVGCTAIYDVDKPRAERIPIEQTRAAIVQPPDGMDDTPRTYGGSGKWVADALQVVLTKRGIQATVGYAPAGSGGRTLRVTPSIEKWSDRATEWSGRLDTLKIRLTVTDAVTGQVLDEREVVAKSKGVTFGGDHPQGMLEDLFAKWADAVFAKPVHSS